MLLTEPPRVVAFSIISGGSVGASGVVARPPARDLLGLVWRDVFQSANLRVDGEWRFVVVRARPDRGRNRNGMVTPRPRPGKTRSARSRRSPPDYPQVPALVMPRFAGRASLFFTVLAFSVLSESAAMVQIGVQVEDDLPQRFRRPLESLPEILLTVGAVSRIRVGKTDRPLVILPRPAPGVTAVDLATIVPSDSVGMVVDKLLPQAERDALEAAGLSWCDSRGALHLEMPGVLIHLDRRRATQPAPKTSEAGIGAAGIRAVQTLLAEPHAHWTVTGLAQQAGLSVGGAHRVFRILEQEQLVETKGRGPQQSRTLKDPHGVLDWLAPIDARRSLDRAGTYLYARTVDELLERFAQLAADTGVKYAVTAGAATGLLGVPVLSRIPVVQARVAVHDAAQALVALGLEHLDKDTPGQGVNLELWTDRGELGTWTTTNVNAVQLAPAVRIYLDLGRQGGRNVDAAETFRRQVLEPH